ncbi:UNKNOWN [Stylonychia lemnae]|uniref:Uncharacterized protein n=1 Tax=Stylonychia lemnae TaxID=5949 RepID=A0A078B3H0_STYLE|nr:UNKNOWN [Stylonychia lemnae]|eukprot:CDW88801.1 UNKNOWN [Stylonychia lemnae]
MFKINQYGFIYEGITFWNWEFFPQLYVTFFDDRLSQITEIIALGGRNLITIENSASNSKRPSVTLSLRFDLERKGEQSQIYPVYFDQKFDLLVMASDKNGYYLLKISYATPTTKRVQWLSKYEKIQTEYQCWQLALTLKIILDSDGLSYLNMYRMTSDLKQIYIGYLRKNPTSYDYLRFKHGIPEGFKKHIRINNYVGAFFGIRIHEFNGVQLQQNLNFINSGNNSCKELLFKEYKYYIFQHFYGNRLRLTSANFVNVNINEKRINFY